MSILIVFVLLLAVGLALGYRLSASSSARKRACAAVEPLRSLGSDLEKQAQEVNESISRAALRLREDLRSERLRAISVDAIKQHASGLRLQALKDAGLSTVLDLQGWSSQQLSGLRGVGPKSANTIAAVVQILTKAADAVPVSCPSPPFYRPPERSLLSAAYVALTFEYRQLPERTEFARVLERAEERLAEIVAATKFRDWLTGIFSAGRANQACEEAERLVCELEESAQTLTLKISVQELLADVRALANREVSREDLTAAYEEDIPLYRWMMSSALGISGGTPRPIRPRKEEPRTPAHEPTFAPDANLNGPDTNAAYTSNQRTDSPLVEGDGGISGRHDNRDTVHVEFGRLVSGPPPIPHSTPTSLPPDQPKYAKTATEALQQLDLLRSARKSERVCEESAPIPSAPCEELVTVRVGKQAEEGGVKIPLPARPAASNKRSRWVSTSDTVVIQGVSISGSYFFLGTQKKNSEPFVLDPSLPIARDAQQINEESALSHRYASFTPHMRFRYLEWLAGGARDRDVPSGFGKLYFHGLERRVLQLFRTPEEGSEDRLKALLQEVKRIEALFLLTPNSVSYQSGSLLRFFVARSFIGASMPALPPVTGRCDELPFELRLGLGCFIKENLPIPAEWALRWVHAEPTIYLRTAPLRCPKEFETAFRYLYGEKYGQGLVLKPHKPMLSVEYQPMWSGGDDSKIQITFTDVPDVKALTSPQIALSQLASEATEMIDAYSRLLGRNVEGAGTLESMLRLPLSIWSQEAHAALQQLRSTVVDPMIPATSETILKAFGGTGEITPSGLTEFAKLLRKVEIGFEPDILAGARKPRPTDYVVLFPLPDTAEETPSPSFQLATVAMTLAAIVALADGHASEEEQSTADRLIRRWPTLSLNSQARLKAIYRLTLKQSPPLSSLRARLEAITTEDRKRVASVLTEMAAADGLVSAEEVRVLERVYRALALDTHTLYANLHSAPDATYPDPSQSHACAIEGPTGSSLDSFRLALLRQQSCEVSELLAGVFTEEDDPALPVEVPHSSTVPHLPLQAVSGSGALVLPGLNTGDQAFVTMLLRRDMWSREELLHAAAELQIMLDGTLERINEAALDQFGETMIEGTDPIYIQQTLLEVAE